MSAVTKVSAPGPVAGPIASRTPAPTNPAVAACPVNALDTISEIAFGIEFETTLPGTDTTPIGDDDTCTYVDGSWVSAGTDTSATISDLLAATTTYYWQVRANIGTPTEPDWIYADKGAYWAFTTLTP